MAEHIYGLLSVLAWSTSAPVVASGLNHIPKNKRLPGILLGLLISLMSGTITLLIISLPYVQKISFSSYLFLAGFFTFPLATGTYYLCGYAFSKKMEIAAQFARVKPIFSVVLSVTILGEMVSFGDAISLAFVVLAILLFILSIKRRVFSLSALLLGFITAFFWSMGEVFIKLGSMSEVPILDTLSSLFSSTILYGILSTKFILKNISGAIGLWTLPFVYHGAVSFGLGYASYYESIKLVGVSKTVLITAFWPVLAILFSYFWKRLNHQAYELPLTIWAASIILCLGSFIQFVS